MTNLVFLTIGSLSLAAGGWRVLRILTRGGTRGLAITLVALGAALILLAGSVQQVASMLYPSLGRLASNVCTLTAAYGLLTTASDLSEAAPSHQNRRLRLGCYLAAIATLTATFFATSGLPTGLGLFGELYHDHPTLVVYVAVYVLYLTVAVGVISRIVVLSLPPSRGALRAGLVSILVGCLLAVAYLVHKIVGVARAVVAFQPSGSSCSNPVSTVSCALSVAAPALSILVSASGVTLVALGARAARRRALAELAPVHQALLVRVPGLAGRRAARSSGDRLVGAVADILDGLLALDISDNDPESAAHVLWHAERPVDTSPAPGCGGTASGVWAEVERLRPLARAYVALSAPR